VQSEGSGEYVRIQLWTCKARKEGFKGSIQDESLLSVTDAFDVNLKVSFGQSRAADVLYRTEEFP